MSGLVGYGSSDEDEDTIEQRPTSEKEHDPKKTNGAASTASSNDVNGIPQASQQKVMSTVTPTPSNVPVAGPAFGPAFPNENAPDQEIEGRPESAHSAYQELIQNLTLPTVPNFNIPPSPPGSPPPGVDAKIQQFLKLKKQGIHFNEKLASSSALKNPSLLGKLIANAGLREDQQYRNSLPDGLCDVDQFQDWMFKENLEQARRRAEQQRHESAAKKTRTSVEFVPGKAP